MGRDKPTIDLTINHHHEPSWMTDHHEPSWFSRMIFPWSTAPIFGGSWSWEQLGGTNDYCRVHHDTWIHHVINEEQPLWTAFFAIEIEQQIDHKKWIHNQSFLTIDFIITIFLTSTVIIDHQPWISIVNTKNHHWITTSPWRATHPGPPLGHHRGARGFCSELPDGVSTAQLFLAARVWAAVQQARRQELLERGARGWGWDDEPRWLIMSPDEAKP